MLRTTHSPNDAKADPHNSMTGLIRSSVTYVLSWTFLPYRSCRTVCISENSPASTYLKFCHFGGGCAGGEGFWQGLPTFAQTPPKTRGAKFLLPGPTPERQNFSCIYMSLVPSRPPTSRTCRPSQTTPASPSQALLSSVVIELEHTMPAPTPPR
jgi:hypothetical protein